MDDDQLFSLDERPPDFECGGGWPINGVVSIPEYLGIGHGPPSELSGLGSSADNGMCSGGFMQQEM